MSCRACDLRAGCRQPVPWRVAGMGIPRVAFGAEAPGEQEDLKVKPLVGRAGQYLDGMLEEAGQGDCARLLFNALCCRPQGNKPPKDQRLLNKYIQACANNRNDQLALFDIEVVILLGATITRAFGYGFENLGEPFFDEQNQKLWVRTHHPSKVMRGFAPREDVVQLLRRIPQFLFQAQAERCFNGEQEYQARRARFLEDIRLEQVGVLLDWVSRRDKVLAIVDKAWKKAETRYRGNKSVANKCAIDGLHRMRADLSDEGEEFWNGLV